ncbi:unnamed protein product [Boreogadus saida]
MYCCVRGSGRLWSWERSLPVSTAVSEALGGCGHGNALSLYLLLCPRLWEAVVMGTLSPCIYCCVRGSGRLWSWERSLPVSTAVSEALGGCGHGNALPVCTAVSEALGGCGHGNALSLYLLLCPRLWEAVVMGTLSLLWGAVVMGTLSLYELLAASPAPAPEATSTQPPRHRSVSQGGGGAKEEEEINI